MVNALNALEAGKSISHFVSGCNIAVKSGEALPLKKVATLQTICHTHMMQLLPELMSFFHVSQTGWNVPEANICILGLKEKNILKY